MCGVPHHAYATYVDELIEKGYKVAICEQLEDPKTTKGMVKTRCYPSSNKRYKNR